MLYQTYIFQCFIIALIIVWIIGMIGFKILYDDTWVDAFYDVAVIITTIAIPKPATTTTQKIFISLFAFVGVLIFLCICGILIIEMAKYCQI